MLDRREARRDIHPAVGVLPGQSRNVLAPDW